MNRLWVVVCQYPGKAKFLLGNVVVDARAKDHDIRAAAIELWHEISPHPVPEMLDLLPGALFFKEESNGQP